MGYVMIVDDDEDFAVAAAEILRNAGHEVQTELQIGSAVESMEQRRPDLVILDVMFPQGSSAGFELARTMRHENEKLKGIPVLMLTAVGQKFPFGFGSRDIDDGSLPVDDYLEKPVDPDALADEVSRLLERTGTGETDEEKQSPSE
jgi:DNA-binding response OmpR family regulator